MCFVNMLHSSREQTSCCLLLPLDYLLVSIEVLSLEVLRGGEGIWSSGAGALAPVGLNLRDDETPMIGAQGIASSVLP